MFQQAELRIESANETVPMEGREWVNKRELLCLQERAHSAVNPGLCQIPLSIQGSKYSMSYQGGFNPNTWQRNQNGVWKKPWGWTQTHRFKINKCWCLLFAFCLEGLGAAKSCLCTKERQWSPLIKDQLNSHLIKGFENVGLERFMLNCFASEPGTTGHPSSCPGDAHFPWKGIPGCHKHSCWF